MKYELKAPVVDAIQWDGTDEGANKIFEFLDSNKNSIHFPELTLESKVRDTDREWCLTIKYLFKDEERNTMYEGMWLVRYLNKHEIMSDERFKDIYKIQEDQ